MKKRIIIMLSVLMMIAFLVVSYTCYLVAHNTMSRQLLDKIQPLTGDNIYSEIQNDLLRPILISSVMAQNVFVRNWVINGEQDKQVFIDYLREIKQRYGAETSFFVSEKTRQYYHAGGVVKTVKPTDKQDDWYFRARALPNEQDYEINVDNDSVDSSTTVIYVNYKMKDYKNQFIGLIGIGLAVQKAQALIEQYQRKYNRTVYFMDPKGLITLSGKGYRSPDNFLTKSSRVIF